MGLWMILNIEGGLLWVVGMGGIIGVCRGKLVKLGGRRENMGLNMGVVIGCL